MVLSPQKSRAAGDTPWAELKSDEHLSADREQNTDTWLGMGIVKVLTVLLLLPILLIGPVL